MRILKKQGWHLLSLLIFAKLLLYYADNFEGLYHGEYFGISSLKWFLIAIIVPVIHQFYVLFCWRIELHYKGLTGQLGKKAFKLYKIGFAFLILCRPISIIGLSVANRNTVDLSPTISYTLSLLLFLPVIYLFYSLVRYFGMDRAFGIDHFEVEKYRNEAYVRKGIFRFSSNAMYVFGFMALWIPAIFFKSEAGLVVALFSHLYIWVHFYFTEMPDMNDIYGKREDDSEI